MENCLHENTLRNRIRLPDKPAQHSVQKDEP
jgi:hypothetical protein